MSPKRAPAAPPQLPGFTYVDVLGSGGFADVFLYEQELPRRRVAVKVLLTDRMSSGSVAEFTAEANVMAMLSTHPSIVTIYQAGVAGDGRPYLVMEYCPKPNLQVRYRREPFSVAEALRIGVQVAGAVETAHRAGVLHRDIKPANVLVTDYNRPALTDFGIASTTAAADESAGLSIPWSPPESFADSPRSDVRSDVYALGATVYTLLAGRSPFEVPDTRNTAAELIQRIETAPVTPIARVDVPASLQSALARSMAKPAGDRYESALAFARALQRVQIELAHSVTPIDILDDGIPDDVEEDDDDGLTRVRGVVSIDPETSAAAGATRPSATTVPSTSTIGPAYIAAPADTVARADAPARAVERPEAADTVLRPPVVIGDAASVATDPAAPATIPPTPPAADGPPADTGVGPVRRSRRGLAIGIGAGVLAAAAVAVVVVIASLSGAAPHPSASTAGPAHPQDPVADVVAKPADLSGTATGDQVAFTWTNPTPKTGDAYVWAVLTPTGDPGQASRTTQSSVTVARNASGPTCIQVQTVQADGRTSDVSKGCTP
jgi:eukaryotic-like serine/threonine-protein kinase